MPFKFFPEKYYQYLLSVELFNLESSAQEKLKTIEEYVVSELNYITFRDYERSVKRRVRHVALRNAKIVALSKKLNITVSAEELERYIKLEFYLWGRQPYEIVAKNMDQLEENKIDILTDKLFKAIIELNKKNMHNVNNDSTP